MKKSNRVSTVILILILSLLVLLVLQSFLSTASAQTVLLGVIAGLMAVLTMQPLSAQLDKPILYKFVPSLDQPILDDLGKDGWRLVCIDQAKTGYIFSK